ncbi:MAG: TonB-dependent receptor domain-containing protein [Gemmatimonadales bacterium]
MSARPWRWLAAALALGLFAAPLAAQTGTISGQVTAESDGRPIAGVNITLYRDAGTMPAGTAVSGSNGSYRVIGVPVGTYRIRATLIGYAPVTREGVVVSEGATASADFRMVAQAALLQEVEVYSVSRRPEKEIAAPASITVIQTTELAERPALTITDHLRSVPGVDISQGGLVQSNVVARGFNNIFSGALLMLIDNRFASVPSLRVNVPAFFPGTGEDLERMELVLGPGAALYGPNTSNGVLNIVTKSPLDYRGTTIAIEGGLRSKSPMASGPVNDPTFNRADDAGGLWRLSGRHAGAINDKFGYKISGEYLTGKDWRFVDQAEPSTLPGRTCDGETCRDFDIEKYGIDGRMDYRPNANTSAVVNYGYTNAKNLIELTGIGAGQAQDWTYQYAQARLRHKRFFAQTFGNFSDAGETFLLRSGQQIVDQSRQWAAQVQQGIDLGTRQTFLFGGDYVLTDARTGGTINGLNEDDDTIREFGGYVHSVTYLSRAFELTTALRADKHSRVEDWQISPRIAMVFMPDDNHSFRLTFNQAFSTPSSNNLFLDIEAGQAGPYTVRALGVPKDGFQFRGGACTAGGVDNLCMRSPFAPQIGLVPVHAALLWGAAVGALQQAGAINAQTAGLLNATAPTPAQVGTDIRVLNPTTGTFTSVAGSAISDIERISPTTTNALEFGYKAILGGRARVSVDLWWENKKNFVGPLIVESPNVFLDRAQTIAHLTNVFITANNCNAAPEPQRTGCIQASTTAAGQLGTGMAGISGGTSAQGTLGVPLATIVPHNTPLTERPDIFLTYRNFGEVDLLGTDIAVDYILNNYFSVAATASFANKDFYTREEVAREGEEQGLSDIALNAPKAKASITGRFRNERSGWSAEARYRAVKGFPINSGVYVTALNDDGTRESIPNYNVMDAQVSYRFGLAGQTATFSLIANNILDTPYQTFVGVPNLGRTLISKLSYSF